MITVLENRLYYLDNFQTVLVCIAQRYADLLADDELRFIAQFAHLPQAARALLVRMVMRKGELFRASKLRYEEIGCTDAAAAPLLALGWIADDPLLTLEQLFGLMKKAELATILKLRPPLSQAKKADQLAALSAHPNTKFSAAAMAARRFSHWHAASGDATDAAAHESVYQLRITSLCERFRLMFFGNLHQDWTEFVLADLGIFTYEKVPFSPASRGFQCRADIDHYLLLNQCREQLATSDVTAIATLDQVSAAIPATAFDNAWLESKRNRLLFQLAQEYERIHAWAAALALYLPCTFPGARVRAVRMLERVGRYEAALQLATSAERQPESEAERQQMARILPRLQRKLGQAKRLAPPATPVTRIDLCLPRPDPMSSVEQAVKDHLMQAAVPQPQSQPQSQPQPQPRSEAASVSAVSVHYVENTLINSLFGLLCWDAVFSPVPGAFFHPFQSGPADLHSADFYRRRQDAFDTCLAQLDSVQYQHTMRRNFQCKAGLQSPFVAWSALDATLLELALACLPAAHLKLWFSRLLQDIRANRSGMPDLIQFWPQEKRYRMIEVKGPGDRLQDNQLRWIDFCATHRMPVAVCYVQWTEPDEEDAGAEPVP